MDKRTSILFDFDGVIAESYALGFEIARGQHPHLNETSYPRLFDGNIYDKLNRLDCGPDCRPGSNGFFTAMRARKNEIVLIPGMDDVITASAKQHRLFLVSSTAEDLIHHVLDPLRLNGYFEEILGFETHVSKVEKISGILSRHSLQSRDCLLITDTLGDIREAQLCSVPSIAVSWGFHDRETLMRGQPLAFVESPAALQAAIESHFMNP